MSTRRSASVTARWRELIDAATEKSCLAWPLSPRAEAAKGKAEGAKPSKAQKQKAEEPQEGDQENG